MYCPSCGQEIPDNSQFCQHCGEAISTEIRGGKEEKGEERGFAFLHGLAGLIGGGIITIFSLLWFSSTQYVYPNQSAIAIWVFLLGIGITVLSPAWFWFGRPISAAFDGINPIRALQSATQGYSQKQKAVGYILGGILLLIGSGSLLRNTAEAVVNRTISPFFIIFPILIVLITMIIIGIGAWHGMAVVTDLIRRYGDTE